MAKKKEKVKKEVIYVADRGYFINNGRIDNFNEVVDTMKKGKNRFYSKSAKFWTGFKKFIAKGSVVDIAVALAISTAFNLLVNSIITSFLNPLISIIFNTHSLVDLKYVVTPAVEANEELGIAAVPEVAFTYGVFLDALLKFIVIALTLYVFVRVFIKLKDALKLKEFEDRMKMYDEEELKAKAEKEKQEAEQKLKAEKEKQEREEYLENIRRQTEVLNHLDDYITKSKGV